MRVIIYTLYIKLFGYAFANSTSLYYLLFFRLISKNLLKLLLRFNIVKILTKIFKKQIKNDILDEWYKKTDEMQLLFYSVGLGLHILIC